MKQGSFQINTSYVNNIKDDITAEKDYDYKEDSWFVFCASLMNNVPVKKTKPLFFLSTQQLPSSLRRDKAEHASLSEPLMRMNETHTRRKISHCERFTNLYNTYNSRLTVPKSICLFQQLNLKKQCRYCLVKAVRC